MRLKKGHSKRRLAQTSKRSIWSAKPQKQAVAIALSGWQKQQSADESPVSQCCNFVHPAVNQHRMVRGLRLYVGGEACGHQTIQAFGALRAQTDICVGLRSLF
jgi:hypothetical protein